MIETPMQAPYPTHFAGRAGSAARPEGREVCGILACGCTRGVDGVVSAGCTRGCAGRRAHGDDRRSADGVDARAGTGQEAALRAELAQLDTALRTRTQAVEAIQRLMTVPGIGALTSTMRYAWIGDVRRFPHAKQLAAYAGLVPEVRQRGRRDPARPSRSSRGRGGPGRVPRLGRRRLHHRHGDPDRRRDRGAGVQPPGPFLILRLRPETG